MIVVPVGALFLCLFAMALPYLIGAAIGLVLAPFYWAYRLVRYLVGVVFRIAGGLYMLSRFVFRATRKLGRFMCEEHHRRAAAPCNLVAFSGYRK
jgi:hypothetical protein